MSRRNPEHPRRGAGIDGTSLPPGDFVSEAVIVAVMGSEQRYLLNYRHFIIGLVGRFKCLRVFGFGGSFGPSDWSGKLLMLDVACLGEDASPIAAQAGSAIMMFPGRGSRGGDPS
jgi:hypothetical protein